jgi:hypothetical protein
MSQPSEKLKKKLKRKTKQTNTKQLKRKKNTTHDK